MITFTCICGSKESRDDVVRGSSAITFCRCGRPYIYSSAAGQVRELTIADLDKLPYGVVQALKQTKATLMEQTILRAGIEALGGPDKYEDMICEFLFFMGLEHDTNPNVCDAFERGLAEQGHEGMIRFFLRCAGEGTLDFRLAGGAVPEIKPTQPQFGAVHSHTQRQRTGDRRPKRRLH